MRQLAIPLVFGALALVPATALAGPNGFDEGPYVHLAPGIIAVPLCCGAAYQSAIGGGYMWTPGRLFKISFGGAFEFYIPGGHDIRFRFLPEARIGAGGRRVWGYGLIGGSFVLRVDDRRHDDDVDPGLGPQVGGGAQFAVWKGLYLGAELDFDIDIFPNRRNEVSPIMWFKAMIGYQF